MGNRTSRGRKVAPSDTKAIAVAPAPNNSSEESSQQNLNQSFGRRSSDSISRTLSRPSSRTARTPSGLRRGSTGRRGSISLSNSMRGEKLSDRKFHPTRVDPFTPSDLAMALSTPQTRQQQRIQSMPSCDYEEDESGVVTLRLHPTIFDMKPLGSVRCPSCLNNFTSIVRIPFLLLCGHTFCSSCIDKALNIDPSFLKCGQCGISTPVDPQTRLEDLSRNKAILDLVDCKDFSSAVASSKIEACAECENEPASVYCSECSASYCDNCSRLQHTGSKVRSKHKPVSINLKPRPQPTCKKHPGQSCVLYCETERQPMCVLCKFYGQHRFHNYQLLSNVATNYRSALSKKLEDVEAIEAYYGKVATAQSEIVMDIRNKAIEAQDKLEKQFAETRQELNAALEQREAVLLALLDKQVEIREQILLEQRIELAFARARALAAKEEATKLLELNPVSALLARKHVDIVMDRTLKQTAPFSVKKDDKERRPSLQFVPIGLRSKNELSSRLQQVLVHHGAVLQLPEKPIFTDVRVCQTAISLFWELPGQLEVTSDRTRSFSLHCFADVPFKYKHERLLHIKKRFLSVPVAGASPESGYDEPSDVSSQQSEARNALPSIPTSLLGSRNVSLVTMNSNSSTTHTSKGKEADDAPVINLEEEDKSGQGPKPGQKAPRALKPLFPEPVQIPEMDNPLSKRKSSQLQRDPSTQASAALLSLPPLLTTTTEDGKLKYHDKNSDGHDSPSPSSSNHDLLSESNTSGILADNEDTPRHPLSYKSKSNQPPKTISEHGQWLSTDSTSTLSDSSSNSTEEFVNIGRYCEGYAFEEIYKGLNWQFRYSGVVPGVTYYFRVLCHNAAGDGPWSDTIRCSVPTGK